MTLLAACGGGGGDSPPPPPPPPAADTTPNSFTFAAQSGTALSAVVASNEIVVSGINAAAAVSITGGEYSINGGAFTSAAGTVADGQRIQVRVTGSNQFSTPSIAVLNVGGVTATFTATTLVADTTPDAFQFQRSAGATRGAWVTSAAATISGINTAAPVTITNGEYSIAGGAFTSAAGSVTPGQAIIVRTLASVAYSDVTRASLAIGSVSADFEVTSELPNYVPDVVSFDGQDVVYLLSNTNRLVFRWSIGESRYLDAYAVGAAGAAPISMAYVNAHGRLYLGYASGAIRQIDVSANNPAEAPFVTLANGVTSLGNAGNFLAAQEGPYVYDGGHLFNGSGVATDQGGYYYGYSRETAWDPVTSRLYYTRDGISPNDLQFDVIDQATGLVTSAGETPYHGSYNIQAPIRVSPDGQNVLLGSGDLYARSDLTWVGSLGSQVADARWFSAGSLLTLTTASNVTTLRRLTVNNLAILEQLTYTGSALRVVGTDARMAVLVVNSGNVQIHTYVPSNDSDGDGVPNTQDAFPLDRAASVDTDGDGFPDAWNAGMGQPDSTTGLALDAFPQDSACWLAAHGNGATCNYGATIPSYLPDQIVHAGDTIYLLSSANRRVYRWSISAGAYLNPYVIGINQGFGILAPAKMAFSASHQRLYLGYQTGAIRYIDVSGSSAAEVQFANTAMAVNGLAAVGNFVLAQDYSGAWATHYVFNVAGVITDQEEWNHFSHEYAWDPNTSRVYFLHDDTVPNNLAYEVINQTTGQIAASGTAQSHGNGVVAPPIRVSTNGQQVLLGTGDIYSQPALSWTSAVGGPLADARWFADGSLVTLTTTGTETALRRLGVNNLTVLEQLPFAGQALRVVGSDSAMVVVVRDGGTVRFHNYVPSNDSDGDGVPNTQDAFPLDRAASVDTDRDGYPDSWNPGRTQADSTTGLVLDAFPQDSTCWLPTHGSGGLCNYGATIPDYVPDQVASHGDIIYLLSSDHERVYRWSISGHGYLNPYVVGISQGFSVLAPTTMAYSVSHQRLYLGYSTGAIRYIDVPSGNPAEIAFINVSMGVSNLTSVGNYLMALDTNGWSSTSYLVNAAGVITSQGGGYGQSREYTWDAVHSRLYSLRDGSSPNDLQYQGVDQATGQFTNGDETPYHGNYTIEPPIRVSVNGQFILLGSGDVYRQNDLNWTRSLATQVADARWLANGSLTVLSTANNVTTLRRLSAGNFALVEQIPFNGEALRVVGSDTAMVVLVINNGTVHFHDYVPSNDTDGDGVQNTQDAFPRDPAASVDTDHDGHPDAWNAGMGPGDSTTGLTLDAYPQDSACYLLAHGNGVTCNYNAVMPDYVPDKIVDDGDVVYLYSAVNRRVYRWSIATHQYLNPYIVGLNEGFGTIAPTRMVYSSAHRRLYFAYATGAIRYLDVNAARPIETAFANTAMTPGGLAAVGNFVLAQDDSGGWAMHYVFNSSGVITDLEDMNYSSPDYAWDPNTSRVYYFRNHSPRDLHYEVIDQTTGEVTSRGETPYHGELGWAEPIHVSPDGEHITLGSGAAFNQSDMTLAGGIGPNVDVVWTSHELVTVDWYGEVHIFDANTREPLATEPYVGQARHLAFGQTDAYLVVILNGTVEFQRLPFYDQDGDSMLRWWETRYGLSDSNAADALTDFDGDGVNNRSEYLNHSLPVQNDTDFDGLTDFQEIVTYGTLPDTFDSDGDGLSDHAEVIVHHSDPRDADSDNDGYTDFDEALYGGNPNNPAVLPVPMTAYNETFEPSSLLAAWTTPAQSSARWAIDPSQSHAGQSSLRSGDVPAGHVSSVRFRGYFAAGQLGFWAKSDGGFCCDYLLIRVDGVVMGYVPAGAAWTSHNIPLTQGVHEIEWRYEKDETYGGSSFGHLDDVTFVAD